jgi:hypothetical protein
VNSQDFQIFELHSEGGQVLSKCANPACEAKFHYLHEGKIYRIDTESLAHASRRAKPAVPTMQENSIGSRQVRLLDVVADRGGAYRPEYFWLCVGCSQDWTIGVHSGSVVVVPVRHPLVQHAAAS